MRSSAPYYITCTLLKMAAAEQAHPTTTVNVEKLKKELWAARREEESYQRENDAKFRAIRQKVASYEEFR